MERHPNGHFKKGSGGRIAGSRNKLQAVFVDELAKDFADHGAGVIRIVRVEKPAEYLKIVASILPKEFVLSDGEFETMSDDDLLEALKAVREAKAAARAIQ